jgi:hypothetical protein
MNRPATSATIFLVLILLVIAAAFVGGRLMNAQFRPAGIVEVSSGPDETTAISNLEMENADELPKTRADAKGILITRQDNSLLLGTGQITDKPVVGSDGSVTMERSHDGPVVEVVTTHDTKIYCDVTDLNLVPASGPVHQVVAPGSLDRIGKNRTVVVWGERHGDRLIASVILYRK